MTTNSDNMRKLKTSKQVRVRHFMTDNYNYSHLSKTSPIPLQYKLLVVIDLLENVP